MQIIGHSAVLRFLQTVREKGTVAHAYLFVGPTSVGKTAVASSFLSGLVGLEASADGADPWKTLRTWPDFSLVEREEDEKTGKRKKMISVDQVRAMRERLGMGSFLESWKIGVVADAETLSTEAANAFLKTLEEPSGKTVLVLIASSLGAVPATVRSRCQPVRFNLVPERDIRDGLVERGLEADRAETLAGIAAGRPGVAITLAAEGGALDAETVAAEAFASTLGSPVWRRIAFAEESAPGKSSNDAPGEAAATLKIWEAVLRDALVLSAGEPALVRWMPLRDRIAAWAGKKSPADVARALRALAEARAAVRENVSPRSALEHVLLNT